MIDLIMSSKRPYSLLDNLLIQADQALKTVAAQSSHSARPSPSKEVTGEALDELQAKHIAGLMRINHTGEVCAQALYKGQALTARLPGVRDEMQVAADEEEDHLAWCQLRINELNSHTSLLNPLFYAASFGVGALAGLAGDKWSLGFVAETERQVCKHLDSHLKQLPAEDIKSRVILEQMRVDEAKHASNATQAGGRELPFPMKKAMTLMSKVMTKTTYHL